MFYFPVLATSFKHNYTLYFWFIDLESEKNILSILPEHFWPETDIDFCEKKRHERKIWTQF